MEVKMKALVKVGRDSVTINNAFATDYEESNQPYKHHLIVHGTDGYFIVAGDLNDETGVFTVLDDEQPAWYVEYATDMEYSEVVNHLHETELPLGVVKCEFSFR